MIHDRKRVGRGRDGGQDNEKEREEEIWRVRK